MPGPCQGGLSIPSAALSSWLDTRVAYPIESMGAGIHRRVRPHDCKAAALETRLWREPRGCRAAHVGIRARPVELSEQALMSDQVSTVAVVSQPLPRMLVASPAGVMGIPARWVRVCSRLPS